MKLLHNKKSLIFALIILIIFGTGFFLGILSQKNNPYTISTFETKEEVFLDTNTTSFDEENVYENPEGFSDIDLTTFWEVWRTIEGKYVPSPDGKTDFLDREKRLNNAIYGLTNIKNDPYTSFLPTDNNQKFRADVIDGEFGGIGVEVSKRNGFLTVVSPLPNSPAIKAGLQGKDVIIEVDGVDIAGQSISESVDLIRGVIGTPVILSIFRLDTPEPFEVTIVRDLIQIPTIDTQILNEDIYLLQLHNFSQKVPDLVLEEFKKINDEGYDKIILDLRNNPGGILEVAVYIASFFVPKNSPVLYQFNEESKIKGILSKGYDLFDREIETVVLINSASASASEILAESLRHYGAATIVGQNSFGKGSVQEIVGVGDGAGLKITIGHWLTPAKESIRELGIAPDIEVDTTDLPSSDEIEENILIDPFILKAIEILNNS